MTPSDHPSPEPNAPLSALDAELISRIQELSTDIGRVLHANTSLLVMVRQTLNAQIELLDPQQEWAHLLSDSHAAEQVLTRRATRLADAIDQFVSATDPQRRNDALPEYRWERVLKQPTLLRELHERVASLQSRLPTLRLAAHETVRLCNDLPSGKLPREPQREMLHAAQALEQFIVLMDVMKTQNAVIQMDYTLSSLRDYVTTGVRTEAERIELDVRHMLEQAVAQMTSYAKSSNVEIRRREGDGVLKVRGDERELTRALTNLLHNAIKYTWRRDRAENPWVRVTTTVQDGQVWIEFQNWGVPIEQEEIEGQQIFELGYRGRWATDRGRLGTGIGLTDAKQVAEAHGGRIQIESRPAARGIREDGEAYYRQPFITKVTVILPLV